MVWFVSSNIFESFLNMEDNKCVITQVVACCNLKAKVLKPEGTTKSCSPTLIDHVVYRNSSYICVPNENYVKYISID